MGRSLDAGRGLHQCLLRPMDDSVPQETGTAGHLFVIIGGKPLVYHIQLRNPPVLGRVIAVPRDGEPTAVEGAEFLSLLILRGQPSLDSCLQLLLDLLPQVLPLPILLLGQIHHRSVGLIHLFVAVFGTNLRSVRLLVMGHGPLFIAIFKIKAYSRMNGTNLHSPVELQPEMHAESHLEEHPMSLL